MPSNGQNGRMKKLLLLAGVPWFVAACAGSTTIATRAPDGTCDAQPVQSAVGQPYSEILGEDLRRRSGAATLRVLRVGQMATREFDGHRLTLQLNGSGGIGALRCG